MFFPAPINPILISFTTYLVLRLAFTEQNGDPLRATKRTHFTARGRLLQAEKTTRHCHRYATFPKAVNTLGKWMTILQTDAVIIGSGTATEIYGTQLRTHEVDTMD